MAFFNLTKLGVQEPIKSSLKECSQDEVKPDTSFSNLEEGVRNHQQHTQPKLLPQSNNNSHQGSYVKYTERLTKHQRTEHDPNEIYRKPVVSSQDYGWWKQDGAPESLSWTKVQRCARVNSEMTRFVDEMTLTNKHFTLF